MASGSSVSQQSVGENVSFCSRRFPWNIVRPQPGPAEVQGAAAPEVKEEAGEEDVEEEEVKEEAGDSDSGDSVETEAFMPTVETDAP
jgi:hypothetical protein